MSRDPRYDILFEPLRIGPVTIKNRFYQVAHCNGLGWNRPRAHAAMREIKAEGGWGAVCTESCSIHTSSDSTPFVQVRLWTDDDIKPAALLVDSVHKHGALAGVQLAHFGFAVSNRNTREVALAPSTIPTRRDPVHARAMDKRDIAEFRLWHRDAALRAKRAGFDIVYVYAADDLGLLQFFLSRRYNHRTDEYGGSIENRVRLLREVIEDTKDAVGETCAVAVRLSVDERAGEDGLLSTGEGREVVELLAELPDLWDVKLSGWEEDSLSSRFSEEGFQEPFNAFVKQVTTKPVVGVGRFTSPDAMVSQIRRGILDLIGAARPSIADPFLPRKIEEGRLEDIRECIGCNICAASFLTGAPIRCTQNPTMGEEERRNWHPEKIAPRNSDQSALIVGAGPAGLECAQALGKRGYRVQIAEATRDVGGRVLTESRLPGLAAWIRVRDYRMQQIEKVANVEIFRESRLNAEQILELGNDHVVIATGAQWRRDGVGRRNHKPVPTLDVSVVFTPDDLMAGTAIAGPVIVFDDDEYYMGGVLAEHLHQQDLEVTLVLPAALVSPWAANTLEQEMIQARLMGLGVNIVANTNLKSIGHHEAELSCVFTGRTTTLAMRSVVLVTARLPDDRLYYDVADAVASGRRTPIKTVQRIGDCLAPGTIADAVFAGHLYARQFDEPAVEVSMFEAALA